MRNLVNAADRTLIRGLDDRWPSFVRAQAWKYTLFSRERDAIQYH